MIENSSTPNELNHLAIQVLAQLPADPEQMMVVLGIAVEIVRKFYFGDAAPGAGELGDPVQVSEQSRSEVVPFPRNKCSPKSPSSPNIA